MQRSRKRRRRNKFIYRIRRLFRKAAVHQKRPVYVCSGATADISKTPRRHHRRRRIVWQRFIPCVCFMALGITSLSLLLNYGAASVRRQHENRQLSEEYADAFMQEEQSIVPEVTAEPQPVVQATPAPMLKDTYRTLSGDTFQKARSLYKQNSDLVGWLYIKGVVNLPVVYRDNEYYLTHDFRKKYDKGGTLFLDENHPLQESTQNLVIHGHNMYDSSMFGILSSYIHPGVVKSNAFASFSTMYAQEDYVVFAVLRVNTDSGSNQYFNYIGKPRFADETAFYNYTGEMKRRSMFAIPIDVLPTDSLLTLATCIDDDRLVVVYRRVRDNESKSDLQELVNQAAV